MKHIRWDMLALPLAGIALGLFLIFRPFSATAALCSLVGWLLLLAGGIGIVNALAFQRATWLSSPLLPFSVAGAIIGLFFILSPNMLVSLVGVIVCVFLLVTGMTNVQAGIQRRRWGDRAWWLPLVVGVLWAGAVYAVCARGHGGVPHAPGRRDDAVFRSGQPAQYAGLARINFDKMQFCVKIRKTARAEKRGPAL